MFQASDGDRSVIDARVYEGALSWQTGLRFTDALPVVRHGSCRARVVSECLFLFRRVCYYQVADRQSTKVVLYLVQGHAKVILYLDRQPRKLPEITLACSIPATSTRGTGMSQSHCACYDFPHDLLRRQHAVRGRFYARNIRHRQLDDFGRYHGAQQEIWREARVSSWFAPELSKDATVPSRRYCSQGCYPESTLGALLRQATRYSGKAVLVRKLCA
jgi:hypothetical protein